MQDYGGKFMKNKKIILLLATSLILGACGNDAAKQADENKEEKPAVEENIDENKDESSDSDDRVKEVADDDKDDDEKVATDDEKNVKEFKRSPIPEVGKTMEEAVDIFYDHFKDDSINIKSIKLDFFNEALDYVIEGFKDGNECELRIAATNGEVVEEKTDKDDDKDEKALDLKNIITAQEAMEKALEGQKEGAWVVEYELEIDDGKAVYDIDIEDGTDVKIDATSGEIIEKD